MKLFGKQFLMVVIEFVAIQQFALIASKPDYEKASALVKKASEQSGNIDYASFCKTTGAGASKLGCQIKEMADVGLLVCLTSDVCDIQLGGELHSLNQIREAKLNVLDYHKQIIPGLKCGAKRSTDVKCSGYLVQWVPTDRGMMQTIRSAVVKDTISNLVDLVREFQPGQETRLKTADDLEKIRKFMKPCGSGYNRICDLQGFFMKTGGFVIADPEGVEFNTPLTGTCYDKDRYPTTQKVINGLTHLIAGITKK
ncbi:Hypothetical predicted protein [Paramuricea clavata]|uniref:Uncharacterized protein n=1 Tax=Paramuricea clavata TaxID=317549 RepID=A0A6S7K791_PARCT|nr:Hypothetical predicted protein [Paramuricea clavata]